MEEYYDAIIVGGGIGGLVAGNYLAKAGLKVALFEQNCKPGGYMSSFQRGSYTFDCGLTSFGSNGIVFPILRELGVGAQLQFTPVKRALVTDQFAVRVDTSLAALKAALLDAYPAERSGLNKYFAWIESFSAGLKEITDRQLILEISKGLQIKKSSLFNLCAFPLHNPSFLMSACKNYNLTKEDWHRRFFDNAQLLDFLNGQGYPVMTANTLGGMWYSFAADYWYPIGGMQHLSNLLAENLHKSGGQVYLNSKVERILLNKDRVTGVLLAKSATAPLKTQECDQVIKSSAVIACLDLRRTFFQLVGAEYLPPALIKALTVGEPSESMFAVYLGLKGKGFAASPLELKASHYFFQLRDGRGGKNEFALIIPTQEDPALARGGETVILHCFEEYSDWAPLAERTTAYYQKKEQRTKECLQLVRQVIPDLDQRLEVIEAATPLTYEGYTGNFKGATAGWSWNPRLRPHVNWIKELPMKGLYLASQWIYNPGGVPAAMLTGRKAAHDLLKQ